ncbi:MAG: ATP-binding protein [Myxococcales bacterium]
MSTHASEPFQSDAHLRSTLEAAGIGTWEWDLARDCVRWSENLEHVIGVPMGSLGTTSSEWLCMVHPEHRLRVAKGVADFIDGTGPSEIEVCVQRPDGSTCWQSMRCSCVRDEAGRPLYLRGIAMNISARRQAQQRAAELAESLAIRERQLRLSNQAIEAERARLRAVLRDAPAAISIRSGPELALSFVNPTFRALMGERFEVGQPLAEAGPEFERCSAKLRQTFASGEPYRVNEECFPIDGQGEESSHRYFNLLLQPMRNAQGEVDSVVSFAVDVTEQVEARRRAEELAHEAETANRTKDEFLAMLGHELRNPLAPILTAIELMKLHDAGYFPRERAVIERQVKYVMRLVDDLLDVSRIAQGKVSIERQLVDLAKCVVTGIDLVRPLISQQRHSLSVQLQEGTQVFGDATRLAQVFANLLSNAAKYTGPGGHIEVGSEFEGDEIRVWVRDTGIGIRSEILASVFEPFVQERQTIDRSGGGLGLGLAIVRSLVELHGGSVEVESAGHGRGSTFSVRLPAAARIAEPASLVPAAEAPPSASCRRILVVDDNTDAAELLADALRYLGHTVTTAHEGRVALDVLDQFEPDLALLDIGLPGMDGYELARRIRSDSNHSTLQLIAVTGYGDGKARQAAHDAGFTGHLAKPVDLPALLEVIARGAKSMSGQALSVK